MANLNLHKQKDSYKYFNEYASETNSHVCTYIYTQVGGACHVPCRSVQAAGWCIGEAIVSQATNW